MTSDAAQQDTPVAVSRDGGRGAEALAALRARWQLPAAILFGRLRFACMQPLHRSSLYRASLGHARSGVPALEPPDPWPGTRARGRELLESRYRFNGQMLTAPAPLWNPPDSDAAWRAGLHGFGWLRDLRAVGGDVARRRARELVGEWIAAHPGPLRDAWAPATTGRRLANWLGQYGFFAATGKPSFRDAMAESMVRQARYLARVLPAGLTGADMIAAIKGLILAGVCLKEGRSWLHQGLELLDAELTRQVLVDGGHVERSPAAHDAVFRDLIDIRGTLAAAGHETPRGISLTIESMSAMLRLFQHGDGRLALFNGGHEADNEGLDMALHRAGVRTRAHSAAPQSGFQRLHAGRTLVLVDVGAPPPPGHDTRAHAGPLAFEMSDGRKRLVVNCGAHPGQGSLWPFQRATAAHSTVTLDARNAAELLPGGGMGRRPEHVLCRREEAEGAILLEMSHDGYLRNLNARHRRRLYLGANGDDLRGEDRIEAPGGLAFAVRFHLHPEVQTWTAPNGGAILLQPRGGGCWRFQAAGAAPELAESIYLGDGQTVQRTRQIVLAGTTEAVGTLIKWAFKREGDEA